MSDSAPRRCRDENGLETSVAIDVQPPRGHWFVAPNDSTFTHLILGACVSDNGQTAVTPELAFGSESMWSTSRGDDLGRSDWAHLGNRSQQFNRSVSSSFREDSSFRSFPKFTNLIQLFVEPDRVVAFPLRSVASANGLALSSGKRRNPSSQYRGYDKAL
jgi:hypothetical protein